MQTVDENPDVIREQPEAIHLYVVREEILKPSLLPMFLSMLTLFLLVLLCVLSSYQQPDIRRTIRVPAVLLPVQSLTTTVTMIPTGSKTYPATFAHGILTITNGSVIASELPEGVILVSSTGTQIQTDSSTFVPAGSAAGYGYATVSAHALLCGKNGNISAYSINQVEGTSMYFRNLQPFTGGRDAYAVKFITLHDRNVALSKARTFLFSMIGEELLVHPCTEFSKTTGTALVVRWTCQPITYAIPAYMKVTGVVVEDTYLLLNVVYRPRSIREGQK